MHIQIVFYLLYTQMIALSKDPQEKALTAKVDIKPTSAPPMISSTISTTKV